MIHPMEALMWGALAVGYAVVLSVVIPPLWMAVFAISDRIAAWNTTQQRSFIRTPSRDNVPSRGYHYKSRPVS